MLKRTQACCMQPTHHVHPQFVFVVCAQSAKTHTAGSRVNRFIFFHSRYTSMLKTTTQKQAVKFKVCHGEHICTHWLSVRKHFLTDESSGTDQGISIETSNKYTELQTHKSWYQKLFLNGRVRFCHTKQLLRRHVSIFKHYTNHRPCAKQLTQNTRCIHLSIHSSINRLAKR